MNWLSFKLLLIILCSSGWLLPILSLVQLVNTFRSLWIALRLSFFVWLINCGFLHTMPHKGLADRCHANNLLFLSSMKIIAKT